MSGMARPRIDRAFVTRTLAGLRPFRPEGFRVELERIGDRPVVHNYGHGGSGWSLSWGSAEVAVGKVLSILPSSLAVIGCGIIGLTSAIVAQRAGLRSHIAFGPAMIAGVRDMGLAVLPWTDSTRMLRELAAQTVERFGIDPVAARDQHDAGRQRAVERGFRQRVGELILVLETVGDPHHRGTDRLAASHLLEAAAGLATRFAG